MTVEEWKETLQGRTYCAVTGGTLIPEKHGDLIDRNELKEHKIYSSERHEFTVPISRIESSHTFIKADS